MITAASLAEMRRGAEAWAERCLETSDRRLRAGDVAGAVGWLVRAKRQARAAKAFGLVLEARERLCALGRDGSGRRVAARTSGPLRTTSACGR